MMSVDTLLSLLTFDNYDSVSEFLSTLLAAPQLVMFLERSPALKQALLRDLPNIREAIYEQQRNTSVPDCLRREFDLYRQQQNLSLYRFSLGLNETLNALDELDSPFAPDARQLALQEEDDILTTAQHSLFFQRWKLSLTLQSLTLNEGILEQQREKLIAELQQRITLSDQLSPLLREDEEAAAGTLWDMGRAPLQKGDAALIKEYSEFLQHTPALTTLAAQLGRSRESKSHPTDNAPPGMQKIQVRLPDSAPEEVSGIHQSDDILRLLPPELAALSLSETELEFYRRLVEKRLLTYQLAGGSLHDEYRPRPVNEKQQDPQPQGPFIVCVDTSGSMGGFNERCAKAFCLALFRIALQEHRRCYIMLFASEVIRYELTADNGLQQATRFLSQRFRGGTDLAYCMNEVCTLLEGPAWHEADAVIISDFIAQRLPAELIRRIEQLRQKSGQRYHAVTLSQHGKPAILKIFDHIWKFDTRLRSRLLQRFRR